MDVVDVLAHLGGIASRATLVGCTSRRELDRAVESGVVICVGHGRYTLPEVDSALAVAAGMHGLLSVTSAALQHGWAVARMPAKPHVTVAPGRALSVTQRRSALVHWASRRPDPDLAHVTNTEDTLADCLRLLPFAEALAVADSALRSSVDPGLLRFIAEHARGPGSPQMRLVAMEATPLAANPFESVLRGIGRGVPGLALRPQVTIHVSTGSVRPDLVDERLRIAVEADSFEWHGGREALARDARRYNHLVVEGWLVLRFAWEHVMHDPAYVRAMLLAATQAAQVLHEVKQNRRRSA